MGWYQFTNSNVCTSQIQDNTGRILWGWVWMSILYTQVFLKNLKLLQNIVSFSVIIPPRGTTKEKAHKLRWYSQEISGTARWEIKNICLTNWPFSFLTLRPLSVFPTCTCTHTVSSCCPMLDQSLPPSSWQESIHIPDLDLPIKTYPHYAPLWGQGCCPHRNDAKVEKEVFQPHRTSVM